MTKLLRIKREDKVKRKQLVCLPKRPACFLYPPIFFQGQILSHSPLAQCSSVKSSKNSCCYNNNNNDNNNRVKPWLSGFFNYPDMVLWSHFVMNINKSYFASVATFFLQIRPQTSYSVCRMLVLVLSFLCRDTVTSLHHSTSLEFTLVTSEPANCL